MKALAPLSKGAARAASGGILRQIETPRRCRATPLIRGASHNPLVKGGEA